ncbi:hypothetical protein SSX86_000440 [Deinandra increscens subsp. villosa]|uniref:Wax synthase domain-containing protein n=1 Tax=Deinandra increscens subsp. villosa TaxID=3103831 RepID=A0AAP0HDJ1_9ASTR
MKDFTEDFKTFINIWFIAIISTSYCYFIPPKISHGLPKLLFVLPIITIFLILPLPISTVHLAFPTVFFLVWLANFKLILFAFNRGPLASTPRFPIATFVSIALLPINPKQSSKKLHSVPSHRPILLAFKAVILILIVRVCVHHSDEDKLDGDVMIVLHHLHLYLGSELVFAMTFYLVKVIIGFDLEIEPQFREPYLSKSLQDFWGRRWNRMSSSALRDMVYIPARVIFTRALGRLWGQLLATFATFFVSGLMHELMFWYLTRVWPTWEVMWFFVLHGVCVVVEVAVKKAVNGRFRLHRAVAAPVTMAFVMVTGGWLLFPQLIRNGVVAKILKECSILLEMLGLD